MPFRANPKYSKPRDDVMYFNALNFSNHVDAMTIPANNRRIVVFTNPTEPETTEYYEELMAALQPESGDPRCVY